MVLEFSWNTKKQWYLEPLSRRTLKACHLQWGLASTEQVQGVIVECGVGSGDSLHMIYSMSRDLMKDGFRQIIAFDSFEGFPQGSEKDSPNFSPDSKKIYKTFSTDYVMANLARVGLRPDDGDVILVKGWLPESLQTYNVGPVSLAHLDLDLYESYIGALMDLWPRITPGGLILIDEYDRGGDLLKWPGAKIAVDEFVAINNLDLNKHWTGFYSIQKPSHREE